MYAHACDQFHGEPRRKWSRAVERRCFRSMSPGGPGWSWLSCLLPVDSGLTVGLSLSSHTSEMAFIQAAGGCPEPRGSHRVACGKCCHLVAETPWMVARLAPLSVEFSRHQYWSGLPFPAPGDLPDPGIEPPSPAWRGLLPLSRQGSPQCMLAGLTGAGRFLRAHLGCSLPRKAPARSLSFFW